MNQAGLWRKTSISWRCVVVACLFAGQTATGALEVGGDAYQESLIESARSLHRLELAADPEGKRIDRIVVVPYDVFGAEELFPLFLNSFHWTTAEDVVRRELLFGEGDEWRQELVDESARNLRGNLFVSVGRIVAMKGSAPESVVVLVVTKDLWSLRINQDWSVVGSRLEHLELEMVEQNLLGRMKTVGPNLRFDLATFSAGEAYRDPRLFGSRVQLDQKAQFILNRETVKSEGGVFRLSIGQPLFSLRSEYAWDATVDYRRDISRVFSAGEVYQKKLSGTGETIPAVYHRQLGDLKLRGLRSFGITSKNNFSGGYRALIRDFEVPTETRAAHSAAAVDEFVATGMPYAERAGMLFLNHKFYTAEYHPKVDIATYAWTEDFRVGPAVETELRLAHPAFGWSARYVELRAAADWGFDRSDHLMTIGLGGVLRHQPEAPPDTVWVDRLASLKAGYVLPSWGPVRLHLAARYVRSSFNLDHTVELLGGNNALRGYPSNYFRGPNLWLANSELRSAPLNVYSSHIGGAVFCDMGDAFENPGDIGIHASVGMGLRLVFPQFNREPIRLDLGFPLESVTDATPAYFVAKFGQAF